MYSFGDNVADLGEYSWYKKNAPGNDPPVGTKKANPWGLFDMHGYVAEWCQDTAHRDYAGAPSDGSAWVDAKATTKTERVIRGGSFADEPDVHRSAARTFVAGDVKNDYIGGDIGNGRYSPYVSRVAQLIQDALTKRKAKIANARVLLWLASDGAVQRFEISGAGPDAERELRGVMAELGHTSERPPQDMPMPVGLEITSH